MRYCILILAFLLFASPVLANDAFDALFREQLQCAGNIKAIQQIQVLTILQVATDEARVHSILRALEAVKRSLLEANKKAIEAAAPHGHVYRHGLVEPFEYLQEVLLSIER